MIRGTLWIVFLGSAVGIVVLAAAFGVNGVFVVLAVTGTASGVVLFVVDNPKAGRRS
ncbi:hypothetical protein [Herbiconiux sp. UC225_62]|uniref:hypothetical protein n=1 Tax=Herbiconiux sp. UC225_62 TaxID=3350168 RepID=UPI0036D2E152